AKTVNALGQVAGDSDTTNRESHGFFYSAGPMRDIGTLGGAFSTVNAMNDLGQVVGEAATTNNLHPHAFLYSAGVLTDLGTFGGRSSAAAINNLGQIVGISFDSTGKLLPALWQNGAMTDLNTLLPSNSGWVLQTATLINDAGQIVGFGAYHGNSTWYLLSLPGHHPPVAIAGPNQTVECSAMIKLNGSGSFSPDGDALTYEW